MEPRYVREVWEKGRKVLDEKEIARVEIKPQWAEEEAEVQEDGGGAATTLDEAQKK